MIRDQLSRRVRAGLDAATPRDFEPRATARPQYHDDMDHAVALVQAYLQLNGYFTSAEYPIIAAAGRNGFRTLTDIDVLAFRFPSGLPSPDASASRKTPRGLEMNDVDPGLGVPSDSIDMLIGEVKEGRVGINSGA